MAADDKVQNALDRARAERDAEQEQAADKAARTRDEAQQIARDMDGSLDRAEAMGDRVETSLRVPHATDDSSEGTEGR